MVESDHQGALNYAYYPGSGVGGDVFLGHMFGTNLEEGSMEPFGISRHVIFHELGHALGLTHPFEGISVLPPRI